MAKRTAIVDIGSNSARLVIFHKTSKHGFHLICEQKSKVRIGEGAYEHSGQLQEAGIYRAFSTLQSFSHTIREFRVDKVIAVATSALRDAPNRELFINRVRDELNLDIKVISGKEEALYGAIAANNLLPISDGITIDIGGGSSDMALIQNNKIIATHTLNLGTVRLKELFFDRGLPIEETQKYIKDILVSLPESFHSSVAIGIGGTARTLAKGIIDKSDYPLNKLHAFEYSTSKHKPYFDEIVDSKIDQLDKLYIKDNRHDTVREGTLILREILEHIGAKRVITSGVGVREGVYLHDILPKESYRLQSGNPSIQSIRDRFDMLGLPEGNRAYIATKLYVLLKRHIDTDIDYMDILLKTLSLSNIGKMLTIYHKNRHAHYIAMQELNYGFSHSDMVLISLLLNSKPSKLYPKDLYLQHHALLPSKKVVKWLSFIYTISLILSKNSIDADIEFVYKNKQLIINSNKRIYLAKEDIKNMKKRKNMEIVVND